MDTVYSWPPAVTLMVLPEHFTSSTDAPSGNFSSTRFRSTVPVAAHAEDGHVILVDELLGQQLDHALAVTAP